RNVGFIQVRVLILEVVCFEPRLAVVEVIHSRIQAHGYTASASIIEPEPPLNVVRDWEGHLSEQRRSPCTKICWRNHEAKCLVERLVKIGPPKNRHFSHIHGYVLENHAIVLVNTDRSGLEMEVGLR